MSSLLARQGRGVPDPEQSPRGPLPTRRAPTCVEQPKAEQQQQQQRRRGRRRPEPGAAVLLSPGGGGGGGAGRCCSHAHARPCRSRALLRGRRRGRSGWAGPRAAAWAGAHASLPPLPPFRPAFETRRHHRDEQGVASGGRRQQGAETSRRPDAGGRQKEAGEKDTKTVSEGRQQPRTQGRLSPSWRRLDVRGSEGSHQQQQQAAAGRAPHRGLRGQSISAPHFRPASPGSHQSAEVPPPFTLLLHSPLVASVPPALASHSSSVSAARGWGSFARALPPSCRLPCAFSPPPLSAITVFWYPIETGDSDSRLARVPGEPAFNLSLN